MVLIACAPSEEASINYLGPDLHLREVTAVVSGVESNSHPHSVVTFLQLFRGSSVCLAALCVILFGTEGLNSQVGGEVNWHSAPTSIPYPTMST